MKLMVASEARLSLAAAAAPRHQETGDEARSQGALDPCSAPGCSSPRPWGAATRSSGSRSASSTRRAARARPLRACRPAAQEAKAVAARAAQARAAQATAAQVRAARGEGGFQRRERGVVQLHPRGSRPGTLRRVGQAVRPVGRLLRGARRRGDGPDQGEPVANEPTKIMTGFSVARWSASGSARAARDDDRRHARQRLAEHLAVVSDLAYVAGWSEAPLTFARGGRQVHRQRGRGHRPQAEPLALDELGKCRWAWSGRRVQRLPAWARGDDRVAFAVSSRATSATTDDCVLGAADQRGVTDLVTFNAGKCRWSRALILRGRARRGGHRRAGVGEVIVVGDYDAPDGRSTSRGERLRAPDRDLFVARFRLDDGALTASSCSPPLGAGRRRGTGPRCSRAATSWSPGPTPGRPSASRTTVRLFLPRGDTENSFVARVSKLGVVWSRGFGDEKRDQMVVSLAVDGAGDSHDWDARGRDRSRGTARASRPGRTSCRAF